MMMILWLSCYLIIRSEECEYFFLVTCVSHDDFRDQESKLLTITTKKSTAMIFLSGFWRSYSNFLHFREVFCCIKYNILIPVKYRHGIQNEKWTVGTYITAYELYWIEN